MSVVEDRRDTDREIEEVLGLVPDFSSASRTTCSLPNGAASSR